MKTLKGQIQRRIALAVQEGVSVEEASFNARQWAKKMVARERLKERHNVEDEEIEKHDNSEPAGASTGAGAGLRLAGCGKAGRNKRKTTDVHAQRRGVSKKGEKVN